MTARTLQGDRAADRDEAARLLRAGRLVALPTETVYGLGANALDPSAVAGVFRAKERPAFDPLIVHVASIDALSPLVSLDAGQQRRLDDVAAAFWPGPLTVVVPRSERVPDLVTSGLPTVAVRVPAHEVTRAVIDAAGVPVAAPSANRFGALSPTSAAAVLDQLGDRIDAVLDGGDCAVGVESTIVSLAGDRPTVLRLGGTRGDVLEAVLGPLDERLTTGDGPAGTAAPQAPGQLSRHYAPRTPLALVSPATLRPSAAAALLVPMGPAPAAASSYGQVRVLSEAGDDAVAAREIFAALRDLDGASVARIDVLPCPETGLGRAINDRLRRAALR